MKLTVILIVVSCPLHLMHASFHYKTFVIGYRFHSNCFIRNFVRTWFSVPVVLEKDFVFLNSAKMTKIKSIISRKSLWYPETVFGSLKMFMTSKASPGKKRCISGALSLAVACYLHSKHILWFLPVLHVYILLLTNWHKLTVHPSVFVTTLATMKRCKTRADAFIPLPPLTRATNYESRFAFRLLNDLMRVDMLLIRCWSSCNN